MYKIIIPIFALFLAANLYANAASAQTYTVDQMNSSFMVDGKKAPSITVKSGDTVSFQNVDTVYHNIFSMSELKTFNLGIIGKGESVSVVFDKAGKVEVSCAIHPRMNINVIVEN